MATSEKMDGLPVMVADRRRRLRHHAAAVLILLIFGAARLPLETRLTQEHQAAAFGGVKLNLGLFQKIGQMSFLAGLSGFRTVVADLLWIDANTAWQRVEYGKMNLLLQTVTTLAPRNDSFWDESAWHMAYNASVMAFDDRKQPKIALRKKSAAGVFHARERLRRARDRKRSRQLPVASAPRAH